MAKAVQPVTYERTDVRVKEHAVYADVVVKDAAGKLFKFSAAAFYFDLTPLPPSAAGDADNLKSNQGEKQ